MMSRTYGWTGKLLRVDLSSGDISIESSARYTRRFIGGRGLGQWILFAELDPSVHPFDSGNKVVFSSGPLVGTLAPMSARLSIDTKNPQSGGVASSNVGGHLAPELKYAGFDAVVVEGRSERPVWLSIEDGRAELRDARTLWGAWVGETERRIRAEVGDEKIRVAAIGPAGENRVLGACVIVDNGRAAGRGGTGAVLGAKGLKALAVRGTGSVRIANLGALGAAARRCEEKLDASAAVALLREGGSHLMYGTGGPTGLRPLGVRNGQDEYWPPERSAPIREPELRERYETRRLACFNCSVRCSHYYRVVDGPYAGAEAEGIQANAVRAFGSNLDVNDPAALIKSQQLCNQLGLDLDAVGACLGWAFECYERGVMTTVDTGGLELVWGNHAAATVLIERMAYREGLGSLLALGVKRAAEAFGQGSESWALHVRGADMNEGAVRANKAWAFGIATSMHAGGHLDGATSVPLWRISPDLGESLFGTRTAGNPDAYVGQERLVFWFERLKAAVDALGLCYFGSVWSGQGLLDPEDLATLLSATTGEQVTAEELLTVGQRIRNVEKAFNTLHAGFTRVDDTLPDRFFEKEVSAGAFRGAVLDRKSWSGLLDAYYSLQAWDVGTGWQTNEGLERLGLPEVADKLRSHGRLL